MSSPILEYELVQAMLKKHDGDKSAAKADLEDHYRSALNPTRENMDKARFYLTEVEGNYPRGMTDCEVIGISGNCPGEWSECHANDGGKPEDTCSTPSDWMRWWMK